jgi:hypothetical protein
LKECGKELEKINFIKVEDNDKIRHNKKLSIGGVGGVVYGSRKCSLH